MVDIPTILPPAQINAVPMATQTIPMIVCLICLALSGRGSVVISGCTTLNASFDSSPLYEYFVMIQQMSRNNTNLMQFQSKDKIFHS